MVKQSKLVYSKYLTPANYKSIQKDLDNQEQLSVVNLFLK